MAEQTTQIAKISKFLNSDNVKNKFTEVLGQRGVAFVSSVLSAVSLNDMLKDASKESIYTSALMAATLDLPINPNLGFAYLIPYRKKGKVECQFQIGYKGFIQLAQRSGQFKTIGATPIYDGQLVSANPLTGYQFDFTKPGSGDPIGYAAYFALINGFEKILYMSVDDLKEHGLKYSQSYKKGYGLWKDNFEAMAIKTVTKLLITKYAPMSSEMQTASLVDQGIIRDVDTLEVEYTDNEVKSIEEQNAEDERESLMEFIKAAGTDKEIKDLKQHIDPDDLEMVNLYDQQYEKICGKNTKS